MTKTTKTLIEVEVTDFENGAILVFNAKKNKFEAKTVEGLIADFISNIQAEQQKLEAELKAVTETYKSQLMRLKKVITGIETALTGGNK